MRILHVVNYAYPWIDGYTVRTMGILAAQRRVLGYDSRILTSPYAPLTGARDPATRSEHWGPTVQRDVTAPQGLAARLRRPHLGLTVRAARSFRDALNREIDRFEPDVLHAHHPHQVGRVVASVARRRALPWVYEIRCWNGDYDTPRLNPWVRLRGRFQNALEVQTLKAADHVVTIAEPLRDRILKTGVASADVSIVRNSVDLSRFPEQPPRRSDDVLHIGYATSFEPIESLVELVEMVPAMLRALDGTGRSLRLTIAGRGRTHADVERTVHRLGLEQVVTLPGFIPFTQMSEFYRDLDLFIVPRRDHLRLNRDTTPLKPLEALRSGVPILASDLPALRELLTEGPTRFVRMESGPVAAAIRAFALEPWQPDSGVAADRGVGSGDPSL